MKGKKGIVIALSQCIGTTFVQVCMEVKGFVLYGKAFHKDSESVFNKKS